MYNWSPNTRGFDSVRSRMQLPFYSFLLLLDHRSTSPNTYFCPGLAMLSCDTGGTLTKSIVPMMATASASKWPLEIWSMQARWANPGALILHLYSPTWLKLEQITSGASVIKFCFESFSFMLRLHTKLLSYRFDSAAFVSAMSSYDTGLVRFCIVRFSNCRNGSRT